MVGGGSEALFQAIMRTALRVHRTPRSLGWCRLRSKSLTLHRLSRVLHISLLYCPLHDTTNILRSTVER